MGEIIDFSKKVGQEDELMMKRLEGLGKNARELLDKTLELEVIKKKKEKKWQTWLSNIMMVTLAILILTWIIIGIFFGIKYLIKLF